MKGSLVIARIETTSYCYDRPDERIYKVKSLYGWQPFCYLGEKGEMMCSGRFVLGKHVEDPATLHKSCKECVYWKGWKEKN